MKYTLFMVYTVINQIPIFVTINKNKLNTYKNMVNIAKSLTDLVGNTPLLEFRRN